MYMQVIQHMRQVRLSGQPDTAPKTDIIAIVILFLGFLSKGRNGSGNNISYSHASLLKLLHGCERWRPVTMYSGRDMLPPTSKASHQ